MKIVLVEDDPSAQLALSVHLKKDGHVVICVDTATAATDLLQEPEHEDVALIILDMMLADGSTGWDVAHFRAFHKRIRHIPMIVTSGMPPEEIRFRARQNVLEGVPMILDKPIDLRKLDSYIQSLGKP